MESRWRWLTAVLVGVLVTAGGVIVGLGASIAHDPKTLHPDQAAYGWYLAGGWLIGGGLFLLFMYCAVWPFTKWMTGPVRDRIMRAGTRPRLEILDAAYGGLNVTAHLNRRVVDGRLELTVWPDQVGVDDPAYGVVKTLDVKYRYKNHEHHAAARDGEQLLLPG